MQHALSRPAMVKPALSVLLFTLVSSRISEALSSVRFEAPTPKQLLSFEAFVQLHNRVYLNGSTEYQMRRELYMNRLAAATTHNQQTNRHWTAGINKFWDWTESERLALRGWDGSARPAAGAARSRARLPRSRGAVFLQREQDLPPEKIWSGLSMARHIRNQADCGSCWAIAAATVLEGHAEIHTGTVRTFSAQQIVACTPNPKHCGGDGGCRGATAELAMDWVMKHGLADESQVPYLGVDSDCTVSGATGDNAMSLSQTAPASSAVAFGMVGWETLPKNEYEPLLRALAEEGPAAVSVSASQWFDYASGVFGGCPVDVVIDHAVTAIGYGIEENDGVKYWVIQNSWGDDWGENGHIRLRRKDDDDTNGCGMNNDPQKGVACKGETAPVRVCGMCGVLFDSVVPHFRRRA